jgi:hypothetical protein
MKGQYPVEETCSELTFSFWYALQVGSKTVYCRRSILTCIEYEYSGRGHIRR